MITPSPTTRISPELARGVLAAVVEATATKPGYIKLTIPDTSYELHLRPAGPISTPVGKRIVGRIDAQARRIDTVTTGGRYIEPVAGRPRRVQGHIVAIDTGTNTITINAGAPIHCKLGDARQSTGQFEIGQFVSGDVLDGATFSPA
ncbi:MAG: hypothetical protein IT436_11625 [Phycisphaerales bacterium]|nr:hypothetical protein [Phycisphaerales bacterium]